MLRLIDHHPTRQILGTVMTVGSYFLPETVIYAFAATTIWVIGYLQILSAFYDTPTTRQGKPERWKPPSSPVFTWLTRKVGYMWDQLIGSMPCIQINRKSKPGSRQQNRKRPSGNAARWTAHSRAVALTRTIKPRHISNDKSVTLVEGIKQSRKQLLALAASYKTPQDGHRYDSDSKCFAIDNCCSKCITNDITDFIEPPVSVKVQGIGGQVSASLRGTVKWCIEDDDGNVHEQIIPGTYYNKESPYKLYSPQHVAQVSKDNHPKPRGTWCATYDDSVVLQWSQRRFTKTVELDKRTNIAIMRSASGFTKYAAFCQVMGEEESVTVCQAIDGETDVTGAQDDEGNTRTETELETRRHPDLPAAAFDHPINNTDQGTPENNYDMEDTPTTYETTKAQLLEWHQRLGHLPFNKIQEMAKRGDLPSKFRNCAIPLCSACLYAKQTRRPWRSRPTTTQTPARTATMPGDIVAIDQMESPTPGLIAQMKGFLTRQRYRAVTVFDDHYSNLSFTYFQKSTGASETMEAKAAFERFARAHGVTVKRYQTDNGIFETDAFRRAVEETGQTISYSGVNAHHQNGTAEGKIRDLQAMARAMLLHAAHRWPTAITANLWPYVIRMANESINNAPQIESSLPPMEKFTQVDVAPRVRHSHPFGCPVYVLADTLQKAGGKINKWRERSTSS